MDKRLCPICSRMNQPQDTHCWFCNAELPPVSAEELQDGDWLLDLRNNDILAAGENEDIPVGQAEEKVSKEDDENAPDWLSRIREREGAERAEKKASEERYWAEKKSHDGLPEWLRSLNEDAAENTLNNSDAQMADEIDQPVVPNSNAPETSPTSSPDDDWLESLKSWQPGEEEIIANQKSELPIPLTTEQIPAQSQSEPEVEKLGLEEEHADSVFDLNKIFSLAEEEPIEGPKSPLDQPQSGKLNGEKIAPESGFDPERFFSFEENEPISEPDPLAEQPQSGELEAGKLEPNPDLYPERFFSFNEDETASTKDSPNQQHEPIYTNTFQSLDEVFDEPEKPVDSESITQNLTGKEQLPFGLPDIPLDMAPIEPEKPEKETPPHDQSKDWPYLESTAENQPFQGSSRVKKQEPDSDFDPERFFSFDLDEPVSEPEPEQLQSEKPEAEKPESKPDLYPERFFSFAGEETTSTSDKQPEPSEPVSTRMFQSLGDTFKESDKPVNPEHIEHLVIDNESLPFGLPEIPSDMAPIEPEKSEREMPPHDQPKDTPIVESTAEEQHLQGSSQAEKPEPNPDLYPERFFSFVGDDPASTSDRQKQLSEAASTKMFQSLGDAFEGSEKPVTPEQIEHLEIDKESLPFGLPDIPSDMVPIELEKVAKDSPFLESSAEDHPYQGISQVEGQSPAGLGVDSFQMDSEPTNELPKAAHAVLNDLNTEVLSNVSKNAVLPFDLGSSNLAEDPFKADSVSLDPFEPDDLPGWLADVKPVDKLDEKPELPGKPMKTRIVIDDGSPKPERGKLPVWLASRRPVEALDLSSPIEEKASTSETSDLEQSIAGVAAGASVSALIEKSSGLERGLKISSRQKTNATLLSVIATSVESTEETAKTAVFSGRLNVWRSLLALVFIAVSFLGASTLNSYYLQPALFPEEVAHTFNLVNSIPLDKPVLIAGDFDAGFAGEIRLTSQSIIEHLMRRDLNIAIMAINPVDAALLTDQINKGLSSVPSYSSANKMVDLGYLPGGAIAVQNMGNSFVEAVPLTAEMVKVTANEITKNVQNLRDFGAIIVITDKSENARVWIEQIQPTLGDTPLLMVTSAQASPLILPYYQSGQVDGLVSGMAGGMIYEQILGSSSGAGRNAASLQLLSVLMAFLVLIGGFTSLVNPKSGWRKR